MVFFEEFHPILDGKKECIFFILVESQAELNRFYPGKCLIKINTKILKPNFTISLRNYL